MAKISPRLYLHGVDNAKQTVKVRVDCVIGLTADEERSLDDWRVDCVILEQDLGPDRFVLRFGTATLPQIKIPECPRVVLEQTVKQSLLRSPNYELGPEELYAQVTLRNACSGQTIVKESPVMFWPLHWNQPPLPVPPKECPAGAGA